MNRKDFSNYVDFVKERTSNVLQAKGDEYSYNSGAFENFEEGVSIGLSNTPEGVAWGYVTKHIQSVRALIREVDSGKEDHLTDKLIDEKFGDVINYMILIEAMLKERIQINN
jgi:predicted RNA-binding protein with EMAP domain